MARRPQNQTHDNNSPVPGDCLGKGGRGGGRNSQPPGKAVWVCTESSALTETEALKAFLPFTDSSLDKYRQYKDGEVVYRSWVAREAWRSQPHLSSHSPTPLPVCLLFSIQGRGRPEKTRSWQPSWLCGHKENEYLSLAQWKPPKGPLP